jgi:TolB protein
MNENPRQTFTSNEENLTSDSTVKFSKFGILLFLLAAAASLGPPGRAADLSGHKLLVTSVRTGDTEVFIADPTTGDMFNVSRSPLSEDRYPCWSPEGKRICFMSDREGTTNLWICNADGSSVHRLNRTTAVCYMPSWQRTPRGERIVFGKHGNKPEMASIKPDGSGEEVFGVGHDPTLSPDGKLICYTGEIPGGVSVFVMNYDGTQKRQVVKEVSKVGATFPNWSPDSKKLVYSFPVGDALELYVIQLDGMGERQLTKFGGTSVCTPSAWSPDGKWISFRRTDERYWSNKDRMQKIYSEKPPTKRPVWVIRPDGSEATLVEPLHFQMAIDGSRAAWAPAP